MQFLSEMVNCFMAITRTFRNLSRLMNTYSKVSKILKVMENETIRLCGIV
jgi:hypothetical protein